MNVSRIGFDRIIRLPWLDETVLQTQRQPNRATLRQALSDALKEEVKGEAARHNTVSVLTRIWWSVPSTHLSLRNQALLLYPTLLPDQRLALHWGMTLLAYPFFANLVTITGRLLHLQGTLQMTQVHQRITADWGTRTSLKYAIPRALHSLSDWGAIQTMDKPSIYYPTLEVNLATPELAFWLLEATLRTRATSLPLNDLLRAPELFPFKIPFSQAEIQRSNRFDLDHQGLNLLMVHAV